MTNVTDTDSNEELQPSGSEDNAETQSGASETSTTMAQDDDLDADMDLDDDFDPDGGETMESVMDMYEESFKRFAEGEVVTGRIISIDRDHVLVDIGYKSEGQIRIQE